MKTFWKVAGLLFVSGILIAGYTLKAQKQGQQSRALHGFDHKIIAHSQDMIKEGREVFRFNTFGDESFWGDTLELHKAIEGSKFGGVGPGVSPATATAVGLKIDVDALPQSVIGALKVGQVDLNDPAVTLARNGYRAEQDAAPADSQKYANERGTRSVYLGHPSLLTTVDSI
jgi:precorrin-4 methylase